MAKTLVVCLSILCVILSVKSQDPSVGIYLDNTEVEIHGLAETVQHEGTSLTIHKYLGIPFAEPPEGEMRFRRPKPVQSMDSPFQAKKPSMPCVQFNFVHQFPQSEDCLYLNIYKPGLPSDSDNGHAVAIWIHGGSFVEGSGDQYDATFMALYGNVIVVTINYRLGLYGFMSTEDDNAPGNYAFWDQHMAFQWVHDNIDQFGGDRERVTIFGESAGAMSVSFQGLNPKNVGLFQRAISQSGAAIGPGLFLDENALHNAQMLGMAFQCDVTETSRLMDCLRSKSTEEIKNTMMTNGISPMDFGFVVDKELIMRDIKEIPYIMDDMKLEEVEFYRSLDVMNGFNSHDGFLITELVQDKPEDLLMSRETMKSLLGPVMEMLRVPLEESVLEMVMGEYTNWTNPDSHHEVRLQFVKLFGDYLFGAPAVGTAMMHAMSPSSSANYVYHLTANPPFGPLQTPEWIPGANHADDIIFMFGIEQYMPGVDPNNSWEIQLSRKMVTYWTNFMKTGSPNYPTEVSPMWPEYDWESQSYMDLEENTTAKSVGHYLYAREHNFWSNVLPHINKAISGKSNDWDDCYSTSAGNAVLPSVAMAALVSILAFLFVTK